MSENSKKRKKSYYVQSAKGKKQATGHQLDDGLTGFLITCNNVEKKAVKEAYNVLNEYADLMYGSEKIKALEDSSDQDNEDFESAIQKDVESLQEPAARRFQVIETTIRNCIFVKTPLEHPDELVTRIFADAIENKKSKSRFILKLFPVLGTCKAAEDRIEKLCEEVLPPFLKGADAPTFCVIYKVRCNNSLGREAIIQLVAKVVADINPLVKVKFDDPDLVISVDILQKICCLSVMRNFDKFRKYNLQEVISANRSSKDADAEHSEVATCEKDLESHGCEEESAVDLRSEHVEPVEKPVSDLSPVCASSDVDKTLATDKLVAQ